MSHSIHVDGDEMNLHVAQGYESISEIQELMMVSKNMVSSQGNRPVMGIIQDTLVACRLFTTRDIFLEKEDVMQLLMSINQYVLPIPSIIKPIQLWTGKQIISVLFSPELTLRKYSAWHDEEKETPWFSESDTEIYIDSEGELLSGILCKKVLGTSSCGLVHKAWLYDNEKACRMVSLIQFLVNKWFLNYGFSVGISDCVIRNETEITTLIDNNMKKIETILKTSIIKGENPLKKEVLISNILNNARDVSGRYVQKDLDTKNNLYTMVSGGSKGSVINIAQIMACVGQQNVNNQRVGFGYDDRTLPHFKKFDHGPESRGFVKHSYMQGLSPCEFFFHAMGGREGVIDTAIKTSETGYIQRRLVKAMEDISICFEGMVKNSIGDIVQFKYGEDGFDGSLLFPQKVDKNDWGIKTINLPINLRKLLMNQDKIHDTGCVKLNNISPLIEWVLQNNINLGYDINTKRTYINDVLNSCLITPGEMVGVIAAQSLGQPITQMTLNTFHFSGIATKSVTLGVPRLKELINMSKNIKSPTMTIKIKKEHSHKKMYHFIGTTLTKYVNKTHIHFKLPLFNFEKEYLECLQNEELCNVLDECFWTIIYELNVHEIGKQGISMIDLTVCIQRQYENVWCICNDETDKNPKLVIRIMSNYEEYDQVKLLSVKMSTDLNIKGYVNIKKCYVSENVDTIETSGSDLENVLNDEIVDPYETFSNNIIETYQILGIEAARELLFKEIKNVIEYDGSYVDYRHISLLIDTMTYKGMLMSITRHGINRTESGVLMRCSFEETINIITDAAIHGECDNLKGITEHIIVGKHSKIGTGVVDILIDPYKLIKIMDENEIENKKIYFRPSTPDL